MTMWMVRAGRGAERLDDFIDRSSVGLGWANTGSAKDWLSKQKFAKHLSEVYPEWKKGKVSITAGQIFRFCHEVEIGDSVLTYDSEERMYHVGTVTGPYSFDTNGDGFAHARSVKWVNKVDRDALTAGTRNTLGAISSFFQLSDDAESDIQAVMRADSLNEGVALSPQDHRGDEDVDETAILADLEARALEFVKDELSKLDDHEMEELVAGLLRAMGYKTQVSPAGPDRGRDVIASPDGFGFESPRIAVEVKHRRQPMGAPEIRSFLGGRRSYDKGLYVSTGGFTREAHYEADRAQIPLLLMSLDGLALSLIEYYESLDVEIRQLFPMKKLYWPVAE